MKSGIPNSSWLIFFFFLASGYFAIFAEARIEFIRNLTGAQIDVLPGLMVYAGISFRRSFAISSAIILGLLFDSLSANPLGASAFSLALLAFAVSYFRELLLSDRFFTHWILGLCASAVVPALTLAYLQLDGRSPLLGAGTFWQWALMTAGGGALTPLWFKVFDRLDLAFRYKEVPESVFRSDRQIARGRH